MASKQNKKKTTNTQKKRTVTKKKREQIKQDGIIQDEIILVVTMVVSLLMFLSNLDLGGAIGGFLSGILFGLFGGLTYVLPFIIFFGTAFYISNMGNRSAGRKLMSAIVFLVALTALIQLLTTPYDDTVRILEYYTNAQRDKNGGGLLGGLLVMFFCKGFGVVGAYIISIAVMVISIIVITGKAIFTYIAKKSKSSLVERREYQKLRREQTVNEVAPSGFGFRRPAKTFVLDPELASGGSTAAQKLSVSNINSKDKKQKKDIKNSKDNTDNKDSMDDLPIVNLDHLFMDKTNPITEQEPPSMWQTGSVPTYEDELRSKFGVEDHSDLDTSSQVPAASTHQVTPSTSDTSQDSSVSKENPDDSTVVERKSKSSNNDSTNVEPIDIKQTTMQKKYVSPPMTLLTAPKAKPMRGATSERHLKETAMKLQSTLESFGVHVTITNISCGPAVTRYELQPDQGVKVKSITSLSDDIKLSLAASEIRIEAPIPGKSAVGIEVPNKENSMVTLREILESNEFMSHPSDIAFAVGKDIGGQTVVTDIAKMPHLLIAGATGSGKSVCINTLVMSILFKSNPTDVRLIMVDPKVVELSVYNGIPHLLIPVVTDPKKASAALNWAVMEMTERYKKFADLGVRDLKGYNEKVAEVEYLNDENYQKLPQIVIIVDELADLMMVAPGEVEDAICRLAQMARAAGLHLIIATQRPSVNVITGLIKANVPSRVAFAVSSAIDSRTIIDGSGAEKLLGKGDMLFFPSGYPKPVRIQGAFVSDKEVSAVVEFLKKNNQEAEYSEDINEKIANAKAGEGMPGGANERDDYFMEAGKFIIDKDKASIGMLQRVYKIGFNRAARIMDQLADVGVVGPEEGTKPRKILMSLEQFENYLEENG